jgi:hypothetical protein
MEVLFNAAWTSAIHRIVWLLMCTYLIFLRELVTGDADDVEGVSWWAGLGGI